MVAAALLVMVAATAYAEGGIATYALSNHTVEGVTPYGTSIDLFDYWTSETENDDYNVDEGINAGHQLKFNTGTGWDSSDVINSWVGKGAGPRTGMVMNTLQNGYPSLAGKTISGWVNLPNNGSQYGEQTLREESLAYLFSDSQQEGKTAYMNVGGLLQVDDDGYYYYDATRNFASFNEETNSFTLYDEGGVNKVGEYSSNGQFFPFNSGTDVFTEGYGNEGLVANNIQSNSNVLDHYFGVHMQTQFVQQDGGYVQDKNNQKKPVTYDFSGDDDVWIYIDGVLVGDLGGIHDKASISIDFSTGNITVTAANKSETTTTLKQCFVNAGAENSVSWEDNTFADNTYHTLDFFYLERGNNDSNMSLKYNLVSYPETDIVKVDQDGNGIAGAEFELYAADEEYNIDGDRVCTAVTGSDGTVTLVGDKRQIVTIDTLQSTYGDHFVLRETTTPSGYRSIDDIPLYIKTLQHNGTNEYVLLSYDPWGTGAYALPRVTATAADNVEYDGGKTVETTGKDNLVMFAVVQQKQSDGTWKSMYGDHLTGWEFSEGVGVSGALEAVAETDSTFKIASSGAWQVDVDQLPGKIQNYQYFNNDGTYRVAYYYSTATSLGEANANNTYEITNSDDFDRQFSAHLYIPNTINRVAVQKLDEQGSPVNGATFALYSVGDVEVNEDGTYEIHEGATALQTATTKDLTLQDDHIELDGGAVFTKLNEGVYYIIETGAPDGYAVNTAPVKVIVNDEGVFADAGVENDGIQVTRGIGRLVYSMVQFASKDKVDTTLQYVEATPDTGTLDSNGDINWGKGDASKAVTLCYANGEDGVQLDYKPVDSGQTSYYTVDTGIPRMTVKQGEDPDPADETTIQDLGEDDITGLFTGATIVQVTDAQVGDFTLSKTVEDANADETTPFTFDLSFTLGNDVKAYPAKLLPGEHVYTIKDADGAEVEKGTLTIAAQTDADGSATETYVVATVTPEGSAANSAFANEDGICTVSLEHGQALSIEGLPVGTSISASEQATDGYSIAGIEVNKQPLEDVSGSATAAITEDGDGKVQDASIAYTNEETATLSISKTVVKADDLTPDADTEFKFEIEIKSLDTNPSAEGTTSTYTARKYSGAAEGDPFQIEFVDGSATCTLKDGESVHIFGLPGGADYTVTETGASLTIGEGDEAQTQDVSDAYTTAYGSGSDDKATGTLVSGETSEVAVTNTYEVAQTTLALDGFTKTLKGRDWIEGDQFSFTLTGEAVNDSPEDGFTLPNSTTATVDYGDANEAAEDAGVTNTEGVEVPFSFGDITFTKPGTYEFTVAEDHAGDTINGVTYADKAVNIKVSVNDNGSGGLVATVEKTDEAEGASFVNEYSATVNYGAQGGLDITKQLNGRAATADQFSFTIAAAGESEEEKAAAVTKLGGDEVTVRSVASDAGVAASVANNPFTNMTFSTADLGKTFTYTIEENVPEGGVPRGYTHDNTVYTVQITPEDKGDGTVDVTTVVSDGTHETETVSTNADPKTATVAFVNSYDADEVTVGAEGSATINATKTLKNGVLKDDEFSFSVTDATTNKAVATGTNDADGNITFSEITYTTENLLASVSENGSDEVGTASLDTTGNEDVYTFKYTVTEDKSDFASGVSFNSGDGTVTVTVTDDRAGELSVKVAYNGGDDTELSFVNTYGASAEDTLTLTGSKIITGKDGAVPPTLESGMFSFTIEGSEGAPMPETTTVQNNGSTVSFGPITYTMENVFGSDDDDVGMSGTERTKVFTYTITESGTVEGVANDSSKTVEVTVTDHGNGRLTAEMTKADEGATGGMAFSFVNTYSVTPEDSTPTGAGGLTFTKVLTCDNGTRKLKAGEFSFQLVDTAGNVASTGSNDAEGNVSMGVVKFDKQGTYTYTLSEVVPEGARTVEGGYELDGVTYPNTTYHVTATVTDDRKGNLDVAWSMTDAEGKSVDEATIENEYHADATSVVFGAGKALEGRAVTEGEFTFQLADSKGTVLGTATNDATGRVVFADARQTFDEVGTYEFTVSEVLPEDDDPATDGIQKDDVTYDETVYTARVVVTDDGEGNLVVSELTYNDEAELPTFTNVYTEPPASEAGTGVEKGDGSGMPGTGDNSLLGIAVAAVAGIAAVAAGVVLRKRGE